LILSIKQKSIFRTEQGRVRGRAGSEMSQLSAAASVIILASSSPMVEIKPPRCTKLPKHLEQ
jgi:hypothetical protein